VVVSELAVPVRIEAYVPIASFTVAVTDDV
jgi:hypothetical protein